jgi:hypothetical protein
MFPVDMLSTNILFEKKKLKYNPNSSALSAPPGKKKKKKKKKKKEEKSF